jgi:hypothetical protein
MLYKLGTGGSHLQSQLRERLRLGGLQFQGSPGQKKFNLNGKKLGVVVPAFHPNYSVSVK